MKMSKVGHLYYCNWNNDGSIFFNYVAFYDEAKKMAYGDAIFSLHSDYVFRSLHELQNIRQDECCRWTDDDEDDSIVIDLGPAIPLDELQLKYPEYFL